MRHHGLTIVLASTALLLCACGPPKGKMEFDTGTTQIWSHSLVQGQKESYPPPDLEPVPTEPVAPGQLSFSLLGDEPPVILKAGVGTSYARDLTFRRQVEVHLFARDPQETFDTLAALGDDRAKWLLETSEPTLNPGEGPPWHLPFDAVVPYPFGPHFSPQATVLRTINPVDFWWQSSSASLRAGPGNDPGGQSSVKALRVIPVGLCSVEQPMEELLTPVVQGLTNGMIHGACKPGSDGEVQYMDAISYLGKHRPDRELPGDDDVGGGFFVHGHVRLHDSGMAAPFSLDDCTISFNYDYRFQLKDGRLAIAHTRHHYDYDADKSLCSGFLGNKGFADIVADALQLDVESEFLSTSTAKQKFSRPDSDRLWDCPVDKPPESGCESARNELQIALGSGADVLGIKPGNELDRLRAAAGRLDNWRCANYPTPPDPCHGKPAEPRGRCEFIVRAKRLNVTPQEVELVWFDNVDEYDNPAVALFIASFARANILTGDPDFTAFRQLCRREPSTTFAAAMLGPNDKNYYNKKFVRVLTNDTRCPTEAPAPPPPPQCPCSRDSECPSGVTCDTDRHLCRDVCVTNTDCEPPNQVCYPNLLRCGGRDCAFNDALCHSYEHCEPPGGYGYCKPNSH